MMSINFQQNKTCLFFICCLLLGASLPDVQASQHKENTVLEHTRDPVEIEGVSSEKIRERARILKAEVKGGNIRDITELLFIKDYMATSFGYLNNGKRELAFSELDHAQEILDKAKIKLVKVDPQRFLNLKRKLFEARSNLSSEKLLKLQMMVTEFIQLLKGKLKPSPPSLVSQIMRNWIIIQNYILIV